MKSNIIKGSRREKDGRTKNFGGNTFLRWLYQLPAIVYTIMRCTFFSLLIMKLIKLTWGTFVQFATWYYVIVLCRVHYYRHYHVHYSQFIMRRIKLIKAAAFIYIQLRFTRMEKAEKPLKHLLLKIIINFPEKKLLCDFQHKHKIHRRLHTKSTYKPIYSHPKYKRKFWGAQNLWVVTSLRKCLGLMQIQNNNTKKKNVENQQQLYILYI